MTSFRFSMTHNNRRPVYPDQNPKSQAYEVDTMVERYRDRVWSKPPVPCDTPDPVDDHEEFTARRDYGPLIGALACVLSAAVVITGIAVIGSKMGAW